MPGTADLVMMGIKAEIRPGQQGPQAYAEATINRSLTLPLPNFNPEVPVGTAEAFFHGGGRKYTHEFPRVKVLYEKSMDVSHDLTEIENGSFYVIRKSVSYEPG